MKAVDRNDYGFLRVGAAPNTDAAIIAIVNGGLRIEVISCKFIMCMNNLDVASPVKQAHPDGVVMGRHFWGNSIPSISDAITALGGAINPGFVYSGLNEADAL